MIRRWRSKIHTLFHMLPLRSLATAFDGWSFMAKEKAQARMRNAFTQHPCLSLRIPATQGFGDFGLAFLFFTSSICTIFELRLFFLILSAPHHSRRSLSQWRKKTRARAHTKSLLWKRYPQAANHILSGGVCFLQRSICKARRCVSEHDGTPVEKLLFLQTNASVQILFTGQLSKQGMMCLLFESRSLLSLRAAPLSGIGWRISRIV